MKSRAVIPSRVEGPRGTSKKFRGILRFREVLTLSERSESNGLRSDDGAEQRLLQIVNFDQANPGGVVQPAHDSGVGTRREGCKDG